ncbi:MAG: radical SAM protein [Gemmatimonadaceae bacterium]|nr:radical SAM protein [Gemmatimonadaceae bacterium]MBA3557138.1 radical SAM protein [Gemmatimonadaceae bacterium]
MAGSRKSGHGKTGSQAPLFGDAYERASRMLPILGEQKDIHYYATTAKNVLNGPEVTGMGFWSINPYVGCAFGCAYCYARYAHRYVMERAASDDRMETGLSAHYESMPPWLAFERNIFVKHNAPELLARTLRHGSDKHLGLLRGEAILIGSATDPYQPAERRFRVTRRILEVLADHPGLKIRIITKSPLVTRDIDLLSRIGRHSDLNIHISLITLRRDLARKLEPRSPTPEARVRALGRLREAGIDAGINCMPVLPGITDNPSDLDALVKRVAEAGATYVGACVLRLQSAARERYLPFIAQEFPHLEARYRNTYARSYQAGDRYRAGLAAFFAETCRKYKVDGWARETMEDREPGEKEESPVWETREEGETREGNKTGEEALDERLAPPEQLTLRLEGSR